MNAEQRILEAVGELFFSHGIKRITMDEIASHLGMSKRTIYGNYEDKDSIVNALTRHELAGQERELNDIRRKSDNAIDEIMHTMSCLGKTFKKIHPTVFYDLQKFHPEAWKHFRQFKEQRILSFFEENLKRGIRQGLYRKDLKIKILARFRVEQVEMAFNMKVFPPDKFNVAEVQLVMLDHFLHGIVTLKGHRLINKYKRKGSGIF